MARIIQDPGYEKISWWDLFMNFEKLEEEWDKSLDIWIRYIRKHTDEELSVEVIFYRL